MNSSFLRLLFLVAFSILAIACTSNDAPVRKSDDLTSASTAIEALEPGSKNADTVEQNLITIPLFFEKKLGNDRHGYVPLYHYGRDSQVSWEGEMRAIVPPRLTEKEDVAYGYIYFTGQPGGQLEREILFMVDGYKSETPRFFVDLNNNLNLTDDEPAVVPEGSNFLLTLRAAVDEKSRTFTVRLSFFRNDAMMIKHPEIFTQSAKMLKGYTKRMGGNPVATKHWFGDRVLNVRSASVKIGESSFQIGVYDEDCDGSYATPGSDLVVIDDFESEYLSRDKSDGATPLAEETLVQHGGQTYEVIEVDPAGSFIRIVPTEKLYTRLQNGSNLPDVLAKGFDGKTVSLSSLLESGKFMLIDFWGHWCKGCILSLPALKVGAKEFESSLKIVSIHYGDHEAARKIIAKENLSWLQLESSEELVETFQADSWPYYVLVGEDGRIKKLNISLHEAFKQIRAARK